MTETVVLGWLLMQLSWLLHLPGSAVGFCCGDHVIWPPPFCKDHVTPWSNQTASLRRAEVTVGPWLRPHLPACLVLLAVIRRLSRSVWLVSAGRSVSTTRRCEAVDTDHRML